jgi:RNA polymerase sigma-70 factor (ECF subfamily)
MSESADRHLVDRCLKGEKEAFGKLVEKYQKPIFNAALKVVADWDTAMDVTQNVFVKAYEKLPTYDRQFKFFSWIYRMAINEAINSIRQQKGKVDLENCEIEAKGTPEDSLRSRRVEKIVENAVADLPLDYRMVIVLYYFANLPYDEISYVLDIPKKRVKSRLYSARQMLCQELSLKELVRND